MEQTELAKKTKRFLTLFVIKEVLFVVTVIADVLLFLLSLFGAMDNDITTKDFLEITLVLLAVGLPLIVISVITNTFEYKFYREFKNRFNRNIRRLIIVTFCVSVTQFLLFLICYIAAILFLQPW